MQQPAISQIFIVFAVQCENWGGEVGRTDAIISIWRKQPVDELQGVHVMLPKLRTTQGLG